MLDSRFSSRPLFVVTMTVLATLFGTAVAGSRLTGQPDLLADLLKTALVLSLGTACASYVFWTFVQGSRRKPWRGAVAGFLTALFIVPLPVMIWALKGEIGTGFETGVFGALSAALLSGVAVFQLLTKASLLALMSSAVVGYAVVSFSHARAETSPRPK